MARSRNGGTKGMLSGKLGDVIYMITRNMDGSFRQSMQSSPEQRFNPSTFDQARARCTMATIERAMFTFRDFITSGWEGVDRGQQSVVEFSRYNYNFLKDFLEVMFDDDSDYDVHWNLPKRGQTQPRAGDFRLSQGSLRIKKQWFLDFGDLNTPYWCVRSWPSSGDITLSDWLALNGLQLGDQLVFVQFMEGLTPSKAMVTYVVIATEKNTNPNNLITSSNFRQLLTLSSNVPCNVVFDNSTKVLRVEFLKGRDYGLKCLSMDTVRLRREVNGKIFYNTADLYAESDNPVRDYGWQGMRKVRPSWLDGPSPTPPYDPILPAIYQEVQYIESFQKVNYRCDLDFLPSEDDFYIDFLCNNSGSNLFFWFRAQGFGTSYWTFNDLIGGTFINPQGSSNTQSFNGATRGVRHIAKYSLIENNAVIKIDNSERTFQEVTKKYTANASDMTLWGVGTYGYIGRIYSIKIHRRSDNHQKAWLVPCYRIEDGEIGFYDKISESFFTIKNSQDYFTCGPDVG